MKTSHKASAFRVLKSLSFAVAFMGAPLAPAMAQSSMSLSGSVSSQWYAVYLSSSGSQYFLDVLNRKVFLPGSGVSTGQVQVFTDPSGGIWYLDKNGQRVNIPNSYIVSEPPPVVPASATPTSAASSSSGTAPSSSSAQGRTIPLPIPIPYPYPGSYASGQYPASTAYPAPYTGSINVYPSVPYTTSATAVPTTTTAPASYPVPTSTATPPTSTTHSITYENQTAHPNMESVSTASPQTYGSVPSSQSGSESGAKASKGTNSKNYSTTPQQAIASSGNSFQSPDRAGMSSSGAQQRRSSENVSGRGQGRGRGGGMRSRRGAEIGTSTGSGRRSSFGSSSSSRMSRSNVRTGLGGPAGRSGGRLGGRLHR